MVEILAGVNALFISPHLDDVALSCGGRVSQRAAAGDSVLVTTVFTEHQTEETELVRAFYDVCGVAAAQRDRFWETRRVEDANAVRILGASHLWLSYADAIFRGPYRIGAEAFGAHARIKPEEATFVDGVAQHLCSLWRATEHATVYLPLGIGCHVDHQICYAAAPALRAAGARVLHYEDFPYALEPDVRVRRQKECPELHSTVVDVTDHIERRVEAIACYVSQLSMLFGSRRYDELTRQFAAGQAERPGRYAEVFWGIDQEGA
jgi:LmbE family N-acetylglucosaminyl deacetylase